MESYEHLNIQFEKDDFETIQRKANALNLTFKKLLLTKNYNELKKLTDQTAGTMYSGAILDDKLSENELLMPECELQYINGFLTAYYLLSQEMILEHLIKEKEKSLKLLDK